MSLGVFRFLEQIRSVSFKYIAPKDVLLIDALLYTTQVGQRGEWWANGPTSIWIWSYLDLLLLEMTEKKPILINQIINLKSICMHMKYLS